MGLVACAQPKKTETCPEQIDRLYAQEKIHLIFCSYYYQKLSALSGAVGILGELPYFRDTVDARATAKKDSAVISNLKRAVCGGHAALLADMRIWCAVSRRLARIRVQRPFTLEGYMECLYAFAPTSPLLVPFLTKGRSVSSLSTYEMEQLYFTSIGEIMLLPKKDQANFFAKLRSWDFK